MLWARNSIAITPAPQPVITSLSVAGTNLVLDAALPPGANRAVLEMRSTFDASWVDAAALDVSANGGEVRFVIPKPAFESAFFRLRTTANTTTDAQVSTELQYVTTSPLGPVNPGGEAVFHFKGVVDGSDRIVITRQGAFWEHVNWGWPAAAVSINGTQWDPREKNYLTTTGAVAFLPDAYSLEAVDLEPLQGRDVIALERTNHALVVYLDDTQSGAMTYEFKIHFHPVVSEARPSGTAPTATLKIAANIDGSDVLKITPTEATWRHRAYAYPGGISLNGIPWDVRRTNTLANTGTNTFLPPGVDLSTARIVSRKGRDVVTMWADADAKALLIHFADNPNGADTYELELSFGR